MPTITTTVKSDEKTYQIRFYESLFGVDNLDGNISIDRNTDGYTEGIIFEHKTNVTAYGRSKALSQALIYLTRFNADGHPVPGKIMLVCQDNQIGYLYNANEYADIINDIPTYGQMKASVGINDFVERSAPELIRFDMGSASEMQKMLSEVQKEPTFVKVEINVHNVYGWSNYYYKNADKHGQKPEKKKFFEELRNPKATLKAYINPWTGKEADFTLIMDLLNDPMTQKKIGAFYTCPRYSALGVELLRKAIEKVPEGYDYVICDPCAGTGNLEADLTDEELSHVIINTYELKEWYVLKDRIGHRTRCIIPPIPANPNDLPSLNDEGFLSGANALSKEFVDELEKVIEDTKTADKVIRIWYMNPPYAETTSIEFQKKGESKQASSWKDNYVVEEMKKHVLGAVSNDMGNAFIWSAFNIFHCDYCIVYSPVKYWKAQHLIDKEFIDGYAVNRKHFHAPTPACIMLALWSNKDARTDVIELKAVDLDEEENYVEQGVVKVNRIHSMFSEKYYDNRSFVDDTHDGITCELNGVESFKQNSQIYVGKNWNNNILGYMVAQASGFDNNRLLSSFHIAGRYNAHGFYLRSDNFLEKLPMFAASRYTDHINDWKIMSMIMKSGDGADKFDADVKTEKLDNFLCKCLIWTGLTHYGHIRSLDGSDGRKYINQLCFDGDDTLASKTLADFVSKGYTLSQEEEYLFADWQAIIMRVRQQYTDGTYRYPYNAADKTGYNPEYKYGLYQIDEEVNYKEDGPLDKNGKAKQVFHDGDLNNMLKAFKAKVKNYYINNLVDTLFEYEFLK